MFEDRDDAGGRLGEALDGHPWLSGNGDALVLGIPRGGVPIAYQVSRALDCPMDLMLTRKIKIPWNPEAGLGAVTSDGTVTLNDRLVAGLPLSRHQVDELARETVVEVRRREEEFRGDAPLPEMEGRTVVLVDDGLASGFTAIAGLRGLAHREPARVLVAAPCAPRSTVERVAHHAGDVLVLEVDRGPSFAVASHYDRWWDLADDEVHDYLARAGREGRFQPGRR